MKRAEVKEKALALWENDRARLVFEQPFIGMLAMQLELQPVVDGALPTAATDGRTVFGNANFLCRLSDEDRLFVLAHEVWHCAALHHLRRQGRDTVRWNHAVDYEVNGLLAETGMTVPKGALYRRHWRGWSAESIYEVLPEDLTDEGRGRFRDRHTWRAPSLGRSDPDLCPRPDERIWKGWQQRVVGAWQQVQARGHGGRGIGRLPGVMGSLVRSLTRPQVPWQTVLRRYLVPRLDPGRRQWTTPNRRYLSRELYLPGPARERVDLAVAIDTSGSTQDYLPAFLAELRGIAGQWPDTRIRLIQADADIQSDEYVTAADLRPEMILKGGGGTDFRPVFEALKSDPPRVLVYFTDGFGQLPGRHEVEALDVVWVIWRDTITIKCRYGAVVTTGQPLSLWQ
ncbi:DUF2201 family putative metallopeptidase [Alkalilimnicola ehrlichii MLHE-1]|uniref:Metallopeptidase domain-containing protein n=1 Tax=Alkalilimnicola ehrlichii (strain ATCC BAA-1101 / DSM 17681 / MLHE-1) TaxID=187272 RepID=Q0A8E5_ALKEH|nr:VWA-like domain-containing protein [Alkalilimnicola ehrlichii]ABI56892.1 conserved hypothetical protein [Alkalilimnicola ehrlichii MLHE-1]